MGKINCGRVVLGGIIGGITACFLDWFMNGVLLGQQWEDTVKALNRPNAFSSGSFLFCLIVVYVIGGILCVWTYAAIRPRFGAGVRTMRRNTFVNSEGLEHSQGVVFQTPLSPRGPRMIRQKDL
jgi:hypothetical protein